MIFPLFLGGSQNSRKIGSRTVLANYFWELNKPPVLVSDFGNYIKVWFSSRISHLIENSEIRDKFLKARKKEERLVFSQTKHDELDLKREKEKEWERDRERESPENVFLVSRFGRKIHKFPFSSRNSGGKKLKLLFSSRNLGGKSLSFRSRSRNRERENHDVYSGQGVTWSNFTWSNHLIEIF